MLRISACLLKRDVDAWTSVMDEKNIYKCICVWAYILVKEAFKTGEIIHQQHCEAYILIQMEL